MAVSNQIKFLKKVTLIMLGIMFIVALISIGMFVFIGIDETAQLYYGVFQINNVDNKLGSELAKQMFIEQVTSNITIIVMYVAVSLFIVSKCNRLLSGEKFFAKGDTIKVKFVSFIVFASLIAQIFINIMTSTTYIYSINENTNDLLFEKSGTVLELSLGTPFIFWGIALFFIHLIFNIGYKTQADLEQIV